MKIQTHTEKQSPVAGGWRSMGSGSGAARRNSSLEHRKSQMENGFTLVELLLVLVILATLAAIVLPRFTGTSQRARITAAVTQISTFKTALNAYEVDMGAYPKNLTELLQAPPNSGPNWHGPYLDSDTIPKDPWGNDYIYTFPGKHNPTSFDIMSLGPNGQSGNGEGIIGNWTTGNNAN
ncbi:MAG TPA: type II secretion system major pseudopilin GspG [Candidatus Sulfopaludibacter sp.]|nr:type II secretion system major pseudopilin GspG [Candidatus Sulfopaludibacter sp.]